MGQASRGDLLQHGEQLDAVSLAVIQVLLHGSGAKACDAGLFLRDEAVALCDGVDDAAALLGGEGHLRAPLLDCESNISYDLSIVVNTSYEK